MFERTGSLRSFNRDVSDDKSRVVQQSTLFQEQDKYPIIRSSLPKLFVLFCGMGPSCPYSVFNHPTLLRCTRENRVRVQRTGVRGLPGVVSRCPDTGVGGHQLRTPTFVPESQLRVTATRHSFHYGTGVSKIGKTRNSNQKPPPCSRRIRPGVPTSEEGDGLRPRVRRWVTSRVCSFLHEYPSDPVRVRVSSIPCPLLPSSLSQTSAESPTTRFLSTQGFLIF